MGAITSRQNAGVEEVDVVSNHAYKYPPRSGNYFGSHFIMGGERFDTPQPESYLFGENSDLNFLGCRPTPFPYPPPQPSEPTKTLKCLVNIRKESLRFVRAPVDYSKPPANKNKRDSDVEHAKVAFNIEFTFDCDVKCAITIYYLCTEEFTTNGVSYVARDPKLVSETFHYKKGANQQFCQMTHVFDPSRFSEDELVFDVDKDVIPVAIHCVAEVGPEDMRQSHTTIATAEKVSEGVYLLKALKQKLFVDGLCYLLQEIYGIENKNNEKQAAGDDDTEDNGSECVICMCDIRDTLILPCRHLCLCNSCADSLRYQSNNCPICRAPFRALLQIRALQKSTTSNLAPINSTDPNCENIPAGYEAISLIEALNGPFIPRHPPSAMPDLVETPDNEHAIQAAQILNRSVDKTTKGKGSQPTTPEYETSQGDSKEVIKHPLLTDKTDIHSRTKQYRTRDIIKHVNEKSQDDTMDEDSDAEKLSPLLQNKTKKNPSNSISMKEIKHSKDDSAEVIPEKQKTLREDRGDESDYYTPEEATPNSAPLYDSNAPTSSVESTPQKLPGTPMSHASARSSGDSYSSGSSTRHLLSVISTNGASNDKAVHI